MWEYVHNKLHFGVLNGLLGHKGRDCYSVPKSLINLFIFINFYFVTLAGLSMKTHRAPCRRR